MRCAGNAHALHDAISEVRKRRPLQEWAPASRVSEGFLVPIVAIHNLSVHSHRKISDLPTKGKALATTPFDAELLALPQNLWVQTRSKPSLHQQMTAFLSENIKVGSHFQFRDGFFRHELLRPMGV